MATVIDSLLIELGLDDKKYNIQQKKAISNLRKFEKVSNQTGKSTSEDAKHMAQAFHRVKLQIASISGLVLGAKGVKDFFAGMVSNQAELGRTAHYLGMSARELDAWSAAAESVGGSAKGMQSSMQSMEGAFESYKLGEQSPAVTAFRTLGINIADANGKMRPMRDLLLDISRKLHTMKPQDQIRIASMLGLDRGTLNLLMQGRDKTAAVVDQMYRASDVSDLSVRQSQKAQRQWALYSRELHGVSQAIFTSLLPALKSVDKEMLDFSSFMQSHRDQIGEFFKYGSEFADAFAKKLSDIFNWIEKISAKFTNNPIGNWIGKKTAQILAYGGDKEAQEALDIMANKNSQNNFVEASRNYTRDLMTGRAMGVSGPYHRMFGNYTTNRNDHYITNRNDQHAIRSNYVTRHSNHAETHIGSVNINSQATDAQGIAKDMKGALQQHSLIMDNMQGME